MNNTQLTLAQIVSAILRHKTKCLIVFTSIVIMVAALFLIWPKKYASEGKLFVQVGRSDTNISPNPQALGVSIQDSRETEIKSVEELIKSDAIMEAVVRKIGAKEILESPFDGLIPKLKLPSFGGKSDGDLSPEEYAKLKRIEAAVKVLEESITVFNQKKTSVISVYVKANSPRLAQEIVQEILQEVREIHSQVHAVPGSSAFFQEMVEESSANLEKAMAEQEKFRAERSISSVGAARGTLQDIISSLEKQAVDTEVEISQLEQKINRLDSVVNKTPEMIPVETVGVERKSADDARSTVFDLENERERLLANYYPSHPLVIRNADQLKQMRGKLTQMKDDRTTKTMEINEVFGLVKVQLVTASGDRAGAIARLKTIKEKLGEAKKKMLALNRDEIDANRLERRISSTRSNWELFVTKGREAEANRLLDQSALSTLRVASKPSFKLKHVSPKASLFLPIGVLLGILGGLATALFCERNHLSASLNEAEVEQILEMPILVTLPRVYSSRNMVN